MKRILLFLLITSAFGCGGDSNKLPVDSIIAGEVDMTTTGLTRLMKYYPKDTTIANGDTTVNYHTIPLAGFTAQDGRNYTAAEEKGTVSVHSFFFSTCEGICPIVTSQMTRVNTAFANNQAVKLVSYTVDPEVDNTETLQAYARRYKADPKKWTFLTGDKKALYDQIRYGFYLPDVMPGKGDQEDFIHSEQIVLVDRNLVIRGYYIGTDSLMVDSLIKDVKLLLEEK
jgi:protein SCO1/2